MKSRALPAVGIVLLITAVIATFASPAGAATITSPPGDGSFRLWAIFTGVALVLCGVAVLRRALRERPVRQRAQDLSN